MKFRLLDYLLGDSRILAVVSGLDANFYEQFIVHIKRSYKWSFRRRATGMLKTILLMERQQGGEHLTMSDKVGSSWQSVIH